MKTTFAKIKARFESTMLAEQQLNKSKTTSFV